MEIVDAYTHCGTSKYEPIEKVRQVMAAAGASHAVLVQHMEEYDNTYIGSCVQADPEHLAGVLLVDYRKPKVLEDLERWTVSKRFQGLRMPDDVIASRPEMFAAAGDLGLAIVLFTPEGIQRHLGAIQKEMRSAPFTRLVITHLGNPTIKGDKVDASTSAVLELAEFANVYFQISGLNMFCPYPHEPLYPLIAEATRRFSPNRIIWGSNFPLVGGEAEYKSALSLLLEGRLPIPKEHIEKVAGENALRLWFPA